MKTILVDAVDAFIVEANEGFKIFNEMHQLLDTFANRKLIVTNAPHEKFKMYQLDQVPYEVFTLQKNPPKTDPEYFKRLLEHYELNANEVAYFEHSPEAVASAESVGIKSYHYDHVARDLESLRSFLADNA